MTGIPAKPASRCPEVHRGVEVKRYPVFSMHYGYEAQRQEVLGATKKAAFSGCSAMSKLLMERKARRVGLGEDSPQWIEVQGTQNEK